MSTLSRWVYVAHVTTRPLLEVTQFATPEGIVVRYPSPAELLAACERGDMGLDRDWVDEALARGDLVAAAFDGVEMIGYMWSSYSAAPHIEGIWIEFCAPYRYGYKSFVHPDYRGRRISNRVSAYSDADSLRRGFTHAISVVKTQNYKSIRANQRHPGREYVGLAGYLCLFGRVLPFRSPAVKKLGFRFVPPDEVSERPAPVM
jgi:hypothetical protein